MDEPTIRRTLESAIERRGEDFVLNYFERVGGGYVLKFRRGVVNLVRSAISEGVLTDPGRVDRLLDGLRRDFLALDRT